MKNWKPLEGVGIINATAKQSQIGLAVQNSVQGK